MKRCNLYLGISWCFLFNILCHANTDVISRDAINFTKDKTIELLRVLKGADVLCRRNRAGLQIVSQGSHCNSVQGLMLDAIAACITMVERNLSIHDVVVCSKIHNFDSKMDEVLSEECSKLLSFESIVDFVAVELGVELSIHDVHTCSKLMLIESEVDVISTAVEDLSNTLVTSTESFEDALNKENIESLVGDIKFLIDTITSALKGA